MKQIRDTGNPVDWFPGDHLRCFHRSAPRSQPQTRGSAAADYAITRTAKAALKTPASPSAAGYILEQLADFKNGARRMPIREEKHGCDVGNARA